MRFKNYLLYFVLLLSANFLISCSDDEEETDPEPSNTMLLVANEWRGDQVLVEGTDVAKLPGVGSNAETFETLVLKFNDDNTYVATFTTDGDEEQFEGEWEFNADETVLTVDALGELQIERLTEENLDVTTSISAANAAQLADIFGVDPTLILIFAGSGPIDAEMHFVKVP